MNIQKPPTIQELKKATPKIRNLNIEHREDLSILDKAAVWVTDMIGTMGFFFIVVGWTAIWLTWNTLGPINLRFDPYPAFVLWLFISNMIQLFFLPLLLIGQNLEKRRSEARAEIDFETNVKAEKEIETILTHLEYQNELITTILNKIEGLEKKK
jgi:uncharacterized membrane protein